MDQHTDPPPDVKRFALIIIGGILATMAAIMAVTLIR